MKALKIIVVVIVVICCLCAGGLYYLVATPQGAALLLNQVLSRTAYVQSYGYKAVTGSVREGMLVEQLVLRGIQELPPASECRLGKVQLTLGSLLPPVEPLVQVAAGELLLDPSDRLHFSGTYREGAIDARVSAQRMKIESLKPFFEQYGSEIQSLGGSLGAADFTVAGPLDELQVKGGLTIEECRYRMFRLQEIPLKVDLVVKDAGGESELFGSVTLNDGYFVGSKITKLRLRESLIRFNGDPAQGILDITAGTQVDDVTITVRLEGVVEKPELTLTSEPPLSREELLLILATGGSWRDVIDSVAESVTRDGGVVDKLKEFFSYEEQYINR